MARWARTNDPVEWHSDRMGLLIRLAEFLILLLPLVGLAIGAVRAFGANKRRAPEAMEPAAAPPEPTANSQAAQWQSVRRIVEEHGRTDTRWLSYELDLAKLLDFPVMTDLRDPRTAAFHKAKLRADLLRPIKAEDLLDDRDAATKYQVAVEDYATAFNIAEAEAMRRRRTDFSRDEQQRIARAQSLFRMASDSTAAPQERRTAYESARKELDGLIVLPTSAQASIERGISGEIEG
ncbi:hypothetical protein ATCCBAA256_16410 [Mycobacterium montefiorense]|nr:hypothetical protein ATCCBAA256_16410 [Mycobacterium montefiorense]